MADMIDPADIPASPTASTPEQRNATREYPAADTNAAGTNATDIFEAPTVEPRKKRRRGLGLFITLAVLVALVVVGVFVAEHYARQYAQGYVRDQITQTLTVAEPDDIGVDLGGGSIILQALSGSINDAKVTIPALTVGDFTGTATAVATNVPLDASQPVGALDIRFTVPAKNLAKLSETLGGTVKLSVTLDGKTLRIASDLKILAATIPIAVGLEPSAADGDLVFTPVDIELNGAKVTADELRASPLSGIVGTFLKDQTVCVADSLPKALVLDKVSIAKETLVIDLNGDGAILGGDGLTNKGTC